METQDHKITTPSGHENHGPHLCHKCSWPFPNPHPSARHRRAHKKVCGKVEGYKLSESEAGNSTHSAISDDEHQSDGEQQTPSPIGKKVSVKDGSSGDKSYRSEDETFSDAVTEFSDSGISPGMEEHPEGVKGLNTNVRKIDDGLLKADALGGISVSVNDNRQTAKVNDPESLESATNQPVAYTSLGSKLDRPGDLQVDTSAVKSDIPGDASLQEMNATETIEAKQVLMSSGQTNDLKGIEDTNAGESLVDAVDASVQDSQSVVSDIDDKTSNNESYESKSQEAEGKSSDPLSLSSDLLGAKRKFSVVESKLLEAEEQATVSVPNQAEVQHNKRENTDSAVLKSLGGVNVDKEHEQLDKAEQDQQRISTELSPCAPIVESKAVLSNDIDGGRQMELSDSSKAEDEGRDAYLHFVEEMNTESAAWEVANMKSPILSSAGKPVPADVISMAKQDNYELIVKKALCRSDIAPKKARFSMPVRKILLNNFLSEAEQVLLAKDSLIIDLISAQGVPHKVKWKVYKSGVANLDTNVLTGKQWEEVVLENDFKVGDTIELWRCWNLSSVVYVVKKTQEEVVDRLPPQEAAYE